MDTVVDREYQLQATMLGYFDKNGTRNPVLRASKGEFVKITITNGENMTHDIVMEKIGVRSKVIFETGTSTSITFKALDNDTYFCSIPGHRAAGMVGQFEVVDGPIVEQEVVAGELPKTGDRTLNVDFESGSLQDWTATGEAFADAVITGGTSKVHEPEMQMNPSGKYFVSSGGTVNHKLVGTLTSAPFKVTHPFASFKVSGGALQDTRVELVSADQDKVIFHITGSGRATLQPVVVDLKEYIGKNIFIRLIDNETGLSPIPYIKPDKWAHINFDDFKFHQERPRYANELKQ
ncbi:MAG TPA: cupredoxin domain-containing protein, partial [Cyclobacteriaceae bacterium]|nr:cupredoxin domain-containing protein [Cyclobacteriaceae bacterium]